MVIINVYIYLFKVPIFEKMSDGCIFGQAGILRSNVTECSKNNHGLRQRMLD